MLFQQRSCFYEPIGSTCGCDLLDIVNEAIQQPLLTDLPNAAKSEAIHAFVGFDVGEDRLDDGHSARIGLTARRAVNDLNHSVRVSRTRWRVDHEQRSETCAFSKAGESKRAVIADANACVISSTAIVANSALARECKGLAVGTAILVFKSIIGEILDAETS